MVDRRSYTNGEGFKTSRRGPSFLDAVTIDDMFNRVHCNRLLHRITCEDVVQLLLPDMNKNLEEGIRILRS